ncbi:protein scarlet-like [Planococcus citri]|uniref:protein scarlet-like n=1 Tax=Planococcus citri TaxID=170843 RepID=UPI0031F8147B
MKTDTPTAMETKGVSITWKNLTIKVDLKTQHMFRNTTRTAKELIHNVNGYVKPKHLVAIFGASGSGKTTLMSVLANRQSGDFKVIGDIRINGHNIPPELLKRISGFVYQHDLLVHTLTVSEHLHLAAQIKLDKRITTECREALVNEILMDVGLTECANRLIGTSNDEDGKLNLSGGERKRLSVATELLIKPALLFCDEPTTGLDSFRALNLMTIMRNMTDQKNKTIICSIHQPSAKILDLFHEIILLHDGKVAFSGTTHDALEFFQSVGYSYNKEQNPADYLIQSLLSTVPGRELDSSDRTNDICLKFENSEHFKNTCERADDQDYHEIEKLSGLEDVEHISWLHKFYLITYREVLGIVRDPSRRYMGFIQQMVIAVIMGMCMKTPNVLDQESIQSIKGVLSMLTTENFFPYMFTRWHFPVKMPMFRREYSNNMNTPLIFYLSTYISFLPRLLLDPIIFTSIAYELFGLRKSWFAFLVTISINVLLANISACFGTFLSLATKSSAAADGWSMVVFTLIYPFSGFTMNMRSIPVIFLWVRYIYWMSYTLESLLIVYFQGVEYIQCSKTPDVPCFKTGDEALYSMGFDSENLQRNIIAMCCIYLIFHVLSFIALKIRL